MITKIWNKIKFKKLKIISVYKNELKDIFANFGKQSQKYSSFGPFYEFYLYCFTIGFHSNKRIKLDTKETATFNSVYEWKENQQIIFKNFLTALICEDDIRDETDFDFFSMENIDDSEVNKRIDSLIRVFEEFANGGFEIFNNAYNNDPEEFYDFRSLYGFFEEKVNNSKRLKK